MRSPCHLSLSDSEKSHDAREPGGKRAQQQFQICAIGYGNKRKSGPRTAPRRAGLREITAARFPADRAETASVDMSDEEEETLSPQAKRTRLSTYDESNHEELQNADEGEASFSANDANSTLGVGGLDVEKSRMEDYVES